MTKPFPAEYKPEYCEQIVETMSIGFSATAFAGKIHVSHSTLRKWAREHPDFENASRLFMLL
jgi:DNA-binding transcriptional regulator YiaG